MLFLVRLVALQLVLIVLVVEVACRGGWEGTRKHAGLGETIDIPITDLDTSTFIGLSPLFAADTALELFT